MTALFKTFIFSLLMLLAPTAMAASELQLQLDTEIEVTDRKEFVWADFVRVRGRDENLLRELQKMPWLGDDRRSVTEGLRQIRARHDQVSERKLRVLVPQDLKIKKVKEFSVAEFRRKVENHMVSICENCSLQWMPGFMNLPKIANDWRLDESALKVAGQMVIPVHSGAGVAWVPIKIKIERPGLVLKRAVTAGELVDEALVEIRLVDISNGLKKPMMSVDGNFETARGLPAGHVLHETDVRVPEAVKRGQLIKILSGSEEFEVAVQGVAEVAGRVGDVIRVKNSESGRLLSGRVVDAGVVRIE